MRFILCHNPLETPHLKSPVFYLLSLYQWSIILQTSSYSSVFQFKKLNFLWVSLSLSINVCSGYFCVVCLLHTTHLGCCDLVSQQPSHVVKWWLSQHHLLWKSLELLNGLHLNMILCSYCLYTFLCSIFPSNTFSIIMVGHSSLWNGFHVFLLLKAVYPVLISRYY